MGVEIERKYLVVTDDWRAAADAGVAIAQGYLGRETHSTIRVRTMGERAYLTVKGGAKGLVRPEFEYEIPMADALAMLATLTLPATVIKTRYTVIVDGTVWVVDVFHDDNAPLVMAEVELDAPDEPFSLPAWAGKEVTDDSRYTNSNLSRRPYNAWKP